MHYWNNTCCIKHGVKHKVHQVQRKQIDSHDLCSKCPLRHKLASVLAIGQLYHQSATAPRCTIQLWDVCGLPLPVRSSKLVSCTFLDKFFIPLCFQFLSENYRISRQAPQPFDSHKFQINTVFFSISLKYLPVIYLSLHDNDVMFTS